MTDTKTITDPSLVRHALQWLIANARLSSYHITQRAPRSSGRFAGINALDEAVRLTTRNIECSADRMQHAQEAAVRVLTDRLERMEAEEVAEEIEVRLYKCKGPSQLESAMVDLLYKQGGSSPCDYSGQYHMICSRQRALFVAERAAEGRGVEGFEYIVRLTDEGFRYAAAREKLAKPPEVIPEVLP